MSMTIIVIAIVGFIVWKYREGQTRKRLFFEELRRFNASHGTAFPVDESGIDLILSDGGNGGSIVFDPSTRKLCIVSGKNQHAELLDFSYIRHWQLKWTERSQNGRLSYLNVHFDISTNDLHRPLVRIAARNKTHGDVWNSRLNVLLG